MTDMTTTDAEQISLQHIDKTKLLRILNDAWLGLDLHNLDKRVFNPFDYVMSDPDKILHKLAYLCTRTDYIYFVCKHIFNVELLPIQCLIIQEMWNRRFPMLIGTRGFGKTFLLSLYCMLRAFLFPNRKIVVVGAAFRQSKYLFDYMEAIWKQAPVLRDLCSDSSGPRRDVDMCRLKINSSTIVALPIGDGQKIRGQRANDIIADEFASMSREIFENVIAGFVVVSASPIENVKKRAMIKFAKKLGLNPDFLDKLGLIQPSVNNQMILSGTAYYSFNHFAEYWRRWKKIIHTRGDKKKLSDMGIEGLALEAFDWRDFAIFRIPFELVPEGFMDEAQIARSRATMHSGIFVMEYGACFSKDSKGFFKRSLIEECTGTDQKPVITPNGNKVFFDPRTSGNPRKQYIMGVDPASEQDNFSIVIIELHEDHRRVVYCWTINRKKHKERVKAGLVRENNFYSYCARKIRDLMKKFNIVHIAIDSQGGGYSVAEALHDHNLIKEGELPIWPIIDPDKPQDTDDERGLHILELCNFANYDWYSNANHSLRKDMENHVLLFPRFDSVTLAMASDGKNNKMLDTLEDCAFEIEELKNEMCLIEVSETASGRMRWDTPEIKVGVGKKEKLRKDRYTALVMANASARAEMHLLHLKNKLHCTFDEEASKQPNLYIGPAWFVEQANKLYD